jgi:hypothetical protein
MIDNCYFCHTELPDNHDGWFCNNTCKDSYIKNNPLPRPKITSIEKIQQRCKELAMEARQNPVLNTAESYAEAAKLFSSGLI